MWIESGADVFKSLIMNGSTMLPCVTLFLCRLSIVSFRVQKLIVLVNLIICLLVLLDHNHTFEYKETITSSPPFLSSF